MNGNMTPEIRLAIEAGIKDALKSIDKTAGEARDEAKPDQTVKGMVIDLRLELDEMTIGHDTDKAPTASIPLLPTLALLVKRMGATRDAALKLLQEVMEEALTLDKSASEELLKDQGVVDAEEAVKTKVIAKLPRTPVKKTVKVKGAHISLTGIAQRII
jgi:hypothetical protein